MNALHRNLCVAVIGAALAPTTTGDAAAADALIPRRELFAAADHGAVALASDGGQVAIVEAPPTGRVVVLTTPQQPQNRRAIRLPAGDVPVAVRWSSDNRRLLVRCVRNGAVRLLAHELGEGVGVELAPNVEGSLEVAALSDDRPNTALLAARQGKSLSYWRAGLDGADAVRVLDAAGLERVYFDHDWRPRAAQRPISDGATEIVRRDGEDWSSLHVMPEDMTNTRRALNAGVAGVLSLNEAGDELLLIDNSQSDRSRLYALSLVDGQKRVLAEDADADLRPPAILDRRTGEVLAVSSYFGDLRRRLLAPSLADDLAFLEQHFQSQVGFVNISRMDDAWLVVPLDGGPLRFHAYLRAERQVLPICSTHSALDNVDWSRRTAHVIQSRDGTPLPCHLYVARRLDHDGDGLPDRPCPTLLYIHGGPSIPAPWESWYTNRCLQLLADRGYAVLNVDFRGAGGYGKRHVQHIWKNWGRATVEDLEDAARWAVDQRIAQPGKIGVWGWSYGGLSTMSALAFSPDTFTCGIAMYGLSDLEAFVRLASFGSRRQTVFERIGDPTTDEGLAALRAQSPLFAVESVDRPLLLTHGGRDRTAPRMHSDRFAERLSQRRDDVIYLLYPEEGHDYRSAESWISFWAVAERFLHDHLGGEFEPVGDDLSDPPFEVVAGAELLPQPSDEAAS